MNEACHSFRVILGAWIITGGMNTGIMKLVGEIVQINPDRSRPIHLIVSDKKSFFASASLIESQGIGTWGCVSGFHQLDVHGSNVHYAKPRTEQKGEAPLEPNHTEFIFVDDGSERKYGREIAFRARLEQAISGGFFGSKSAPTAAQYPSLTGTASLRPEQSGISLLCSCSKDHGCQHLLAYRSSTGCASRRRRRSEYRSNRYERGFVRCKQRVDMLFSLVLVVHEAVVQNNIPAVFLEGTGRCCDLFAKAYRLYHEYRIKFELNDDNGAK